MLASVNRGYQARLYPTAGHATGLKQRSGSARWRWNLARDQRRWRHRGPSKIGQCRDLTQLRGEVVGSQTFPLRQCS